MSWELGATTRPWHDISFEDACTAIADAGYTDLAIFASKGETPLNANSTPADVDRVKRVTSQHGLNPSMLLAGPPMSGDVADAITQYKGLIDICVDAGVKYLMECGVGDEALYERYYETMTELAPYAAEKGIELQLKPHGGISLTGADLRKAHERVNSPGYTICYDPGNIIYYTKGENRPETDVHEVAELATTCIIKDCTVDDGQPEVWLMPGEGLVDFPDVLGSLIGAGFDGPFYVECLGGDDHAEINKRAKRVHEWLGELLAPHR
jgi:sugar phosphate isomerase/epimerase